MFAWDSIPKKERDSETNRLSAFAGGGSRYNAVKLNFYVKHAGQTFVNLQGWAKEWSLVCVRLRPVAIESQEAGLTQPRHHIFAQPCTGIEKIQNRP